MKNLFDIMLGPAKKKDDHKARTDLNFSNELAKGIKKQEEGDTSKGDKKVVDGSQPVVKMISSM